MTTIAMECKTSLNMNIYNKRSYSLLVLIVFSPLWDILFCAKSVFSCVPTYC
ncbi:uncharacterized protein DS421_9g285970 [Arachis hypogaea]|nr:uncharacterized protein DS421_9g285970 [Arachis hypogaea]